jgi:hypothetical protein
MLTGVVSEGDRWGSRQEHRLDSSFVGGIALAKVGMNKPPGSLALGGARSANHSHYLDILRVNQI